MLRHLFIFIINLYQHTLSPDHSWLKRAFPYGCCRFYPTCSEYSKESFRKFGTIKGMYLTIKRIFRCNPFNEGGLDPVE
jgi:putative membrane protein insertion efficiency factor